jgi:hypothetical protein
MLANRTGLTLVELAKGNSRSERGVRLATVTVAMRRELDRYWSRAIGPEDVYATVDATITAFRSHG